MPIEKATLLPPDRIFDDLIPKKKSLREHILSLYENRWQAWSLVLFFAFFIVAAISAWGFSLTQQKVFSWAAMVSLICAYVSIIIHSITIVLPELHKATCPEKTLLTPVIAGFSDDVKKVEYLAANFQLHHLKYAEQRLSLVVSQLTHRLALLVGAIDKVGVIPLGVTAYLSLNSPRFKENLVDPSSLVWITMALAVFYAVVMILHLKAQRIQRFAQIISMAIDLKQQQEELSK